MLFREGSELNVHFFWNRLYLLHMLVSSCLIILDYVHSCITDPPGPGWPWLWPWLWPWPCILQIYKDDLDLVYYRWPWPCILQIHQDPDDLGLGGWPDSKTTGHAGARIGCCVIQKSSSNVPAYNAILIVLSLLLLYCKPWKFDASKNLQLWITLLTFIVLLYCIVDTVAILYPI